MSSQDKLQSILKEHLALFNSNQISILENLINNGFGKFIAEWQKNKQDEKKINLIKQIEQFNSKYKNGILKYFIQAKEKLQQADSLPFQNKKIEKAKSFPLENEFDCQKSGIDYLNEIVITLVAGGIGERLGLKVNKLLVPFEPYLKKTYLQYYCESILALENLYFQEYNKKINIPLVIISNEKGYSQIEAELKKHNSFHLSKKQIHLKKQLEVPCFDCEGEIFIEDFNLRFKPHGHGNVHDILLQKEQNKKSLAEYFLQEQKKYLFFMQDTNYASWNILLALIAENINKKSEFSFFTIKAKKDLPMGRIVQIANGKKVIANMEYNYLSQIKQEDFNIEEYYANTNLLFCNLKKYFSLQNEILNSLPLFVNFKKNDKKSALRLEKMMQDVSTFFDGNKANVIYGEKEESFTPFKVNLNNYREKPSFLLAEQTLPYNLEFFFINSQKILSKNNFFESKQQEKFNEHFFFKCEGKVSLHPIYFIFKNYSFKNIVNNNFDANSFVALNGINIIFKNNRITSHSALILNVHPEATLIVENLTIENKGFDKIKIDNDPIHFFDYQSKDVPIINIDEKGDFVLKENLEVVRK